MLPDPTMKPSPLTTRARTPLLIAALLAAGLSCDDPPAPPMSPVTPATSQPAAPTRPTTQALTDGPRQRLPLGAAPMSIEVPESWKLSRVDLPAAGGDVGKSVYLLAGPAPTGDVQLSISQQRDVDGDFIKAFFKTAKEESAADADAVVQLKEVGVNQMLQQRSAVGGGEDAVRWSLGYFVPAGLEYHWYKVAFVDLTPEVFKADRAFLEKIVDSLRLDAADKGPL